MLVHTDPKYMHRDTGFWAVYNGSISNGECEGSVWYGGIRGQLPDGKRLDLFKSWATARPSDPKNVLFEREFSHPLITPAVIEAARDLAGYQGLENLYFSGQYTQGMDLQESALYSAMKVAEQLAPGSSTLESLHDRLVLRGRDTVSYDL
jgi:predicted NAD/FAD-binding protein